MKSLNLFNILFEEEGIETDSGSNEETIIDVILGRTTSDDPEEIRATKHTNTQSIKDTEKSFPEPDIEVIPLNILGESLLKEGSRLSPEEKAKREAEEAEKIAKKEAREAEIAARKAEEAERKNKREADKKTKANERKLFDAILAGSTIFEEMNDDQFFRIKPKDSFKQKLASKEITEEQSVEQLTDERISLFKSYNPIQIKPKAVGSGSGKYYTYQLSGIVDNSPTQIKIVVAAGGNAGQKYEKEVYEEYKNQKGPAWEALACFLVESGKLESLADIKNVILTGGGKRVSRPFAGTMENVGKVIADVVIEIKPTRSDPNPEPIYVSIKNISGRSFANPGFGGVFKTEKDPKSGFYKTTFSNEGGNENIRTFLNILGVDLAKAAKGFEIYANNYALNHPTITVTKKNRVVKVVKFAHPDGSEIKSVPKSSESEEDRTQILNANDPKGLAAMRYLSYQLGYGYVYFRQLENGKYRIIDLKDEMSTIEVFGDKFLGGKILYPYWRNENSSSRQLTIILYTNTAEYYVEIRFTQEFVVPEDVTSALQCNVAVQKTYAQTFECNTDWESLVRSSELARNYPEFEDRPKRSGMGKRVNETAIAANSFLLKNFLFRNKRNKF